VFVKLFDARHDFWLTQEGLVVFCCLWIIGILGLVDKESPKLSLGSIADIKGFIAEIKGALGYLKLFCNLFDFNFGLLLARCMADHFVAEFLEIVIMKQLYAFWTFGTLVVVKSGKLLKRSFGHVQA